MQGQLSLDFIFALIAGLFLVLIANQVSIQIQESAEENSILLYHTTILDKITDLLAAKLLLSDGISPTIRYTFSYPINCVIYLNQNNVTVVTDSITSSRQLDSFYTSSVSNSPFYCGGLFEN